MTTAWIFAGQGSESRSMGTALRATFPAVRRLLEHASLATGEDIGALLERAHPRLLRTDLLQPTLIALELGVAAALRRCAPEPSVVAGHSLGELAAWAAAGGITPEQAVTLAAERGRLMESAAQKSPGSMLGVEVDDEAEVQALLRAGRRVGHVEIAAKSSPGRWALTGEKRALNTIAGMVPSSPLPVAGPWHSAAMQPAADAWARSLVGIRPRPHHTTWVATATGAPVESHDAAALLVGQVTTPVYWPRLIHALDAMGVDRYVAVGPGRGVRQLVQLNLGIDVHVLRTHEPTAFDATVKELGGTL